MRFFYQQIYEEMGFRKFIYPEIIHDASGNEFASKERSQFDNNAIVVKLYPLYILEDVEALLKMK